MTRRYTFVCPCGSFAHDIDVMWAARLLALHHKHDGPDDGSLSLRLQLLPADLYAEAANDMFAEAEWCVSP